MSKRETGGGKGKGPIVVKWREDSAKPYLAGWHKNSLAPHGISFDWTAKKCEAMKFGSQKAYRQALRKVYGSTCPWGPKIRKFIRLVPRRPRQEQPR
jgi:hypothetical protein